MSIIQRSILTGHILNAVTTKNMFTARVTEVGGDTYDILWEAYIDALLTDVSTQLSNAVTFDTYLIQDRVGSQWVDRLEVIPTFVATGGTTQAPNEVAAVLIGKAAGVRHLGRKFWSGIDLTTILGNALNSSALVHFAQLLADYITPFHGLTAGYFEPGILDKTGTFHVFVGGVISSFLGSMRRRKPGVGI